MTNRLGKLLLFFTTILLLAIVIRMGAGEPCCVPSPSMEPAILTGDWLWIDKASYGGRLPTCWADIPLVNIFTWIPSLREADSKNHWSYRRLPGFTHPKESDIVVFTDPENDRQLLVKRIKTIYNKGTFFLVNKNNEEIIRNIVKNDRSELALFENTVQLKGETDSCDYTLQQNFYYLLGDNESNSRDSRYWGCIPEKAIVGRVNRVLFSVGDSRIRLNRFFHPIQ